MNGRITIKLNGNDVQLVFGMLANEILQNKQQIGEYGFLKTAIDLIYAGYANAKIIKGENPESFEVVYDWIDDFLSSKENEKTIGDVFNCYEESKAGKYLLQSLQGDSDSREAEPVKKKTEKAKPTA